MVKLGKVQVSGSLAGRFSLWLTDRRLLWIRIICIAVNVPFLIFNIAVGNHWAATFSATSIVVQAAFWIWSSSW